MSFIRETENGRGFEAGYFMESEVGLVRKTRQIKQDGAVEINGEKYVLAGTLFTGDGGEKGIVYEPVCVTSGDMPGSVVLAGRVYGDLVPSETKSGIEGVDGFTIIENVPEVTRPY